MIILPQLLRSLLKEVDNDLAATLALDFAEQSLKAWEGPIASPELTAASIAYVAAARAFRGSGEADEMRAAHDRFYAARSHAEGRSASATWIAAIAVHAACQRDMEKAGILVRNSYAPTVFDVSAEAQKIAGQFAEGVDESQRARWEAARHQVILLINAVRFPSRNRPPG